MTLILSRVSNEMYCGDWYGKYIIDTNRGYLSKDGIVENWFAGDRAKICYDKAYEAIAVAIKTHPDAKLSTDKYYDTELR